MTKIKCQKHEINTDKIPRLTTDRDAIILFFSSKKQRSRIPQTDRGHFSSNLPNTLLQQNHPPIVLGIEKKVGADDGDADGDDGENDEDEQHKTVDVVYLVGPERGEDEVHLDEDGSER